MPSSQPTRFGTILAQRFPALQHRDFRYLWLGQLISVAGTQMQNMAINWQIHQLTHSPVMLGLVGLMRVLPIVGFSLIGGMVADAYHRRTILVITQSVGLLAACGLAMITALGADHPPLIFMFTAITAAAGAFDGPARQSLIPNLVPPEHLNNAVSLNTMLFQTAMIAGPALSGLVIDWGGVEAVYWINAVTFVAVLAALAVMRFVETHREGAPRVSIASMVEGLRFVRSSPLIFSTMILDFFATFFASATALLPIFAADILKVGAKGMGLLAAADSVGSLVTGFIVSMMGEIRRKGRVLLVSVALYGIATALYGFSTSFVLSLIMLFLVGAGDSVSTILRVTIRQTMTPDNIRGRTTSINMIFFLGGPQLGNLEAGLLATAVGAPLSVAVGGFAVLAVVGVVAWAFPKLRAYDR
ncbi:MAG: MFS transporter [Bacteroidetes bacterium]|nr:MFS transporter [Bacteroidota bacterium]